MVPEESYIYNAYNGIIKKMRRSMNTVRGFLHFDSKRIFISFDG